ncbi:hypothetical protein [Enterococcus sp. AZ192]|uniref:TreTu family toxin n=1 Tax=unclassified Enterococcus TaxID=2608891 RepID=UPI003D2B0DC5
MGLKFYVSEAQARSSQAAQLNGQAGQAIASLQSSIQLFLSAPLSSKAYDSAKNYFMVAYTPLCQSAIMTGEALESAHKKFLSDYQGSVSGIDTDEDLILEEINRFEDLKRDLDQQMSTAKTPRPDLERRYMNACDVITQRREKLAKFHAYNGRSASIFSEYQACQREFNAGLAQVKECKAWNSASGTFDLGRLNMSWAKPITTRWEQREKMRQEKLKNGSTGKANMLADHGLTEADLVQVSDPPELVYQKYIKFAALGLNPHTGKPLTDKEKWQFQYAGHAGTMSDLIGLVGGAYAGQKASDMGYYNNIKKVEPVTRNPNTTTVGRWMSDIEYNKMKESGKVQMSPNGNRTYVATPPSKEAFPAAPKGSLYTEFDVNSKSIYPAGNKNWGQIPGPGSLIDRLNQKKGLPPITEMPDALNIKKLGEK